MRKKRSAALVHAHSFKKTKCLIQNFRGLFCPGVNICSLSVSFYCARIIKAFYRLRTLIFFLPPAPPCMSLSAYNFVSLSLANIVIFLYLFQSRRGTESCSLWGREAAGSLFSLPLLCGEPRLLSSSFCSLICMHKKLHALSLLKPLRTSPFFTR